MNDRDTSGVEQFDVCWDCRDTIPDETVDEWPLIRCAAGDSIRIECDECGVLVGSDDQYVHVLVEP